jgi:hypothetical protein
LGNEYKPCVCAYNWESKYAYRIFM